MAERAGELKWHRQRGAIACQQNNTTENVEMKVMKQLDRQGDSASLTIMFSNACLASQQLRNTGMKRFLKAGKITCQEERSVKSAWLSHHVFLFMCRTQSQDLSQGKALCEHVPVVMSLLYYCS